MFSEPQDTQIIADIENVCSRWKERQKPRPRLGSGSLWILTDANKLFGVLTVNVPVTTAVGT